MVQIIRTDSENPDFIELVKALDLDLKIRDGEEHAFFAQYNKIDHIRHVVLACQGDEAVGCGAVKAFDDKTMEVKRMYVPLEKRGQGIASLVLQALEQWCIEMGYERCILETGLKQPEAIRLYEKNNYRKISNYGQYAQIESSVCFEKVLI